MKSVRGEKARNGRDFFDTSIVVGVVDPLAGGELVSGSNSATDVALGVEELASKGEAGRSSKSDKKDMAELDMGRGSL
jgi:hypothetical protein